MWESSQPKAVELHISWGVGEKLSSSQTQSSSQGHHELPLRQRQVLGVSFFTFGGSHQSAEHKPTSRSGSNTILQSDPGFCLKACQNICKLHSKPDTERDLCFNGFLDSNSPSPLTVCQCDKYFYAKTKPDQCRHFMPQKVSFFNSYQYVN